MYQQLRESTFIITVENIITVAYVNLLSGRSNPLAEYTTIAAQSMKVSVLVLSIIYVISGSDRLARRSPVIILSWTVGVLDTASPLFISSLSHRKVSSYSVFSLKDYADHCELISYTLDLSCTIFYYYSMRK